MMQGEKVAGDLREAHDAVAGSDSPVPALASAVRRLERRATQAPGLLGPAVQAFDAALNALEEARGHLEQALRAADHDPLELERIEERLFALRAAGRKYNSPVDNLSALAAKYAADLALIDAGRRTACCAGEGCAARHRRNSPNQPMRCRRLARRAPRGSTRP